MDYSNPMEVAERTAGLDQIHPGWREMKHPNGQRMWSDNGMMLDSRGMRSIFDDVDE